MSDALEALRAIDAIPARLADRMADAIADLQFYDRKGVRWKAYSLAGIHRHHYPDDVFRSADVEAQSIEYARRLS